MRYVRGAMVTVTDKPIGSTLVADHEAGEGVLSVYDAFEFSESPGGMLQVGDETIAYIGIDDDQGLIFLDGATQAAWEDGTTVAVVPVTSRKVMTVRISDDGGPVEVDVPSIWFPMVEAIIADPDAQHIVTLRDLGDEHFELYDIPNIPKRLAGDSIKGPIPPESQPAPVAPAYTPEPVVIGLFKQILAMMPGMENPTTVTYEYHLALTNAAPPDEATVATESTATGVSLTRLPDGTAEGTPLEYDTDYYVATWAKSGDQYAPEPSAWVLVRLDQAGTPDIKVGSITAALFSAIITVSNLFRTAELGQRVEFDNNGIRVYDSTGAVVVKLSPSEVIILADYMYAKFLETGGAKLGGRTEGPAGGEFALGTSILPAPGAALQFSQDPSMVALPPSTPPDARVQIVTDGTHVLRFYIDSTQKKILCRRSTFAGADLGLTTVVDIGGTSLKIYTIDSAGATTTALYASVTLSDFSERLWRFPRPTASTWGTRAALVPTSGPGGTSTPIVGVQHGSGNVLLAHRVDGAQTIGGVAYADGEIMVRRFTPSVSGSDLILTLNKTIKTGVVDFLDYVHMDADGGTFDTPADSGKTSVALTGGFTGQIVNVASGSSVTATSALGAAEWDGLVGAWRVNVLYDGSTFWDAGIDPVAAAVITKRPNNAIAHAGVGMGFTYWDGTHETMLSPALTADLEPRFPAKWTIPTIPSGITEVRLYLSGDPATRTRYERVGTFAAVPGQALLIDTAPIAPPADSATNPPPEESDFPGGDVYLISTADPETAVYGDGKMTARDPLMPTDVMNKRVHDTAVSALSARLDALEGA